MAKRIPEETIAEILDKVDIVELIGRHVNLEKKGANWFGLCPFHHEKTPSFSVSPQKQIFYCFGCHKGGNAIAFVRALESLSFPEAVMRLASDVGVTIDVDDDGAHRAEREAEARLRAALLHAARFYYKTLIGDHGKPARAALKARGVSPKTARTFGLGLAPAGWDSLVTHLRRLGVSEPVMIDAGLAQTSSRGGLIDVFRNRIMIPIFDFGGRIVAFGGRSLEGNGAKYVNSRETTLYQKRKHLFGLNVAKTTRDAPFVVVEGYFDAMALHTAGVTSAVALLGTALSHEQARLLAHLERPVVLNLDADRAGVEGTLRALALLAKHRLSTKVVRMPACKDPDEFVQTYGGARYAALIEGAVDAIDYRLALAQDASQTDDGELDVYRYQDEATALLASIDNAVVRELKAKQVANTIHMSPAVVHEEVERRRRGEATAPVEVTIPSVKGADRRLHDEAIVVLALLERPARLADTLTPLDDLDLSSDGFGRIAARLREALTTQTLTLQGLLDTIVGENEALREALLAVAVREGDDDVQIDDRAYRRAVLTLKRRRFAHDKARALEALNHATNDEERKAAERCLKRASEQYNAWRQRRL